MKRYAAILMAMLFAIALSCSIAFAETQSGETLPECTSLEGGNINANNLTVPYATPVYSYLTTAGDQYMRVQGFSDRGDFSVVYYDKEFKTVSRKDISAELPIFGGFYDAGDYYYIVSGTNNPNESNDVEVFRITKYDTSWNRVGSCGLFGANTYIPFDAGSCRMTSYGSTLTVRTCHEMYQSSDGYHHQANVAIVVNTDNMSVTASNYSVGSGTDGYVSHSFNQFIKMDGSTVVAVDHGDAHPRSVCLNLYTLGSVRSQGTTNALTIAGDTGQNYTGVSVGGLEISDSNYLIAVSSVKQDASYNTYNTRNITIVAVDKSTKAATEQKLTNITEGDGTTGTPHIVKTSTNRFMVLWRQGSKVKYAMVDGSGAAVSEIYSMDGNLSDCVPLLEDGNVVWYTWKNAKETFYEIPVNDLDNPVSHEVIKGHLYELNSVENGLADVTCTRCGEHATAKVPTSYTVWWSKPTNSSYTSSSTAIPSDLEAGSVVNYKIDGIGYSAESDLALNNFIAVSSDSENCIVDTDNQTVTFKKGGNYTVTLYPEFNPTNTKKSSVYVVKSLEGVTLTASKEELDAPGTSIRLQATADGGRGTLQYKFVQIDSKGNESVIQEQSTQKYCYWTPDESGDYQLRVDVTDPGDNNNMMSSNVIDFHVHGFEWLKTEDGLATLKCDYCNSEVTGRVPTSFRVYWKNAAASGSYYSYLPSVEVGESAVYMTSSVTYSAESSTTYGGFTMECEDTENCVISGQKIAFNKAGSFKVYIYPTYNPALKYTATFVIKKDLEGVVLKTEQESPQAFGSTVKLIPDVDGGRGTLKYTYTAVDSAGSETVLASDVTNAQYEWTAPAAGTYKLRVSVKDTGDEDRTVTSENVDFVISKAPHPSVMPEENYTVSFDTKKLTNDILAEAEGWAFNEADLGKDLVVGETAQFTAQYQGADAGNFEDLTAVVKVTRADCEHKASYIKSFPAVAATCEKGGNTAYWQCEHCGKYFSDASAQTVIQEGSWVVGATGHDWEEPSYSWSDDNGTVTATRECKNDASHKQTENVGTSWTITKDATCSEKGVKTYTSAAFVNEAFAVQMKEVPIDELPHTWGEWSVKTPPNCVEEGVQERTCEVCGESETAPIAATPEDVNAHDWDEGVETTAPKCFDEGVITYTCNRCHATRGVAKEAIGHHDPAEAVAENEVAPTCTEPGHYDEVVYCKVCNTELDRQEKELPATGHDPLEYTAAKEPTCTEDGNTEYWYCPKCKIHFSDEAGENPIADNGWVITAPGHQWNEGNVTKEATCTSTGTREFTCTVCKETRTETVGVLPHDMKPGYTPATLKAVGSEYYQCSVCGAKERECTIYSPTTFKLSATAYTYSGTEKKPTVTVKNSLGKTLSATSYSVSYSKNKYVGTGTVKVTLKAPRYSGTKALTFKINPKGTSLSKLTPKKKAFTVTWKKQATQTTGYQIQYSLSSKFASGNKLVTVAKTGTTSKTISKLKAKKRYYVRVRTYKTVSGTKYYSAWSAKKYVKTK